METIDDVTTVITRRAAEVGVRVRLHAADVAGPGRLGINADALVVPASVFKVPIAVELARQAAAGELDLGERVTIAPGHPTPSPYGLATFHHDVTMSWHDLAVLMIGISDNVATDLIFAKVGRDAVADLLRNLGLERTALPLDCGELLRTIGEDLGVPYADDERALAGLTFEQVTRLRALRPERSCRTTPEEMTRLLGLVWRDEAAPPEACADVRRWLGQQVWPHRLRSGFADDGTRIGGKTGTLPTVRNEVGVVEYPDGGRYAVAIFTEAGDVRQQVPDRDAFIGFAAARAVEWLRRAQ